MLNSVSGFSFSGLSVNDLESSQYTIANILCDVSSSVSGFKDQLENAIIAAVEACRKSPLAEQMLVRVGTFASNLAELHGFVGLNDIKTDDYKGALHIGGSTALYDATLESIETIKSYGEKLVANRFTCNGIAFVITDGEENTSVVANPSKIKAALEQIQKDEKLESLKVVLVGVGNQASVDRYLKDFAAQTGLSQYVWIGDATPQKLARLADFVSKSISSSSAALGSGGASQNITF